MFPVKRGLDWLGDKISSFFFHGARETTKTQPSSPTWEVSHTAAECLSSWHFLSFPEHRWRSRSQTRRQRPPSPRPTTAGSGSAKPRRHCYDDDACAADALSCVESVDIHSLYTLGLSLFKCGFGKIRDDKELIFAPLSHHKCPPDV